MANRRIERLNSLLKEVVSDVIRRQVKHPRLPSLITITRVDVSIDVHYAKVYVSMIGDDQKKREGLEVLRSAAGFIAVQASKQVQLRYFPELTFLLDDSAEHLVHIDQLITKIQEERKTRPEGDNDGATDSRLLCSQ